MASKKIEKEIEAILQKVRKEGDRALEFYSRKFDGIKISAKDFFVPAGEIRRGFERVPAPLRDALGLAKKRIELFHKAELRRINQDWFIEEDGVRVGQVARPMESVGIYAPGGRFCYPSTVLMAAIPAKVAGVKDILLATPGKNLGDEILAAAWLAGVTKVLRVGGPWAIAAMAFGTKTVGRADKIVGPGNQYVTEAKRQIFGTAGIDGLAGPSEIAVWADSKADPEIVAQNLMAQAEHDPQAKNFLLTTRKKTSGEIEKRIAKEFLAQMDIHVMQNDKQVIDKINEIAPEHLFLAIRNPRKVLPGIRNAGAIFLGENTPVALGDYAAGPSHVLPTGKSARFASGLSVKDFLKWSSVTETLSSRSEKIFNAARTIAASEGLHHHATSLSPKE